MLSNLGHRPEARDAAFTLYPLVLPKMPPVWGQRKVGTEWLLRARLTLLTCYKPVFSVPGVAAKMADTHESDETWLKAFTLDA